MSGLTEFDRALHDIWNEIDLDTSAENFKSAIKQAVDKHVIGSNGREIEHGLLGGKTAIAIKTRNDLKDMQRQLLWGKE